MNLHFGDANAQVRFQDDSREQDWFLAKYAAEVPGFGLTPGTYAFGVPRVPDVRGRVLCRSDHQSDWPDLPASSTCATGPARSTDFLIRRRGRLGDRAEPLTSRSRRASASEEWGHSRRCAAASRDDRSHRSPGRARLENPPAA